MYQRLLFIITVVLAGCSSEDVTIASPATTAAPVATAVPAAPHHLAYRQTSAIPPADQLAQVKRATARYRTFENATHDGYVDIGVVLPNMGRHFMKQGLVDSTFEVEHPELLVYQPTEHGGMELVAVEYAVPLSMSANAPEGFRGTADQWSPNQTFGLWLLHAWVWKENPDGVFNPTNSRVP